MRPEIQAASAAAQHHYRREVVALLCVWLYRVSTVPVPVRVVVWTVLWCGPCCGVDRVVVWTVWSLARTCKAGVRAMHRLAAGGWGAPGSGCVELFVVEAFGWLPLQAL